MQNKYKYSLDKLTQLTKSQIFKEFEDLHTQFYGSNKYENQMYNCKLNDEKKMNRYTNILPYKNNIIKAKEESYYNASEIKLLHGERMIATQAPVKPFSSFWKIVLEENVGMIIMLCALEDPKRGKQADQYWPDEGTIKEQSISVTLNSQQSLGQCFEKRVLLVSDGTQQKSVAQLHWHGWKDFGVPSIESIVIVEKLLEQIHQTYLRKENIVLHCSAGVGRTGTLMAIVDGVGLLKSGEKEISVFEIVSNIRQQRFGSVQTEEQYEFVHKFLRNYIQKK